METLSALLVLCEANDKIIDWFFSQRAISVEFWYFFVTNLNKFLNKQLSCLDFRLKTHDFTAIVENTWMGFWLAKWYICMEEAMIPGTVQWRFVGVMASKITRLLFNGLFRLTTSKLKQNSELLALSEGIDWWQYLTQRTHITISMTFHGQRVSRPRWLLYASLFVDHVCSDDVT